MSLRNNFATNFMATVPFCFIAAGLIGASVFAMMGCSSCQELNKTLDARQRLIHEGIVQERRKLAIQGLVLGLVVSALYLYLIGSSINPFANGCVYAGLTMAITYFYYLLMPKTTYLVQHLNTKEQLDLYADANRTMQWRGLTGTLLGFLGLALVPFITRRLRQL